MGETEQSSLGRVRYSWQEEKSHTQSPDTKKGVSKPSSDLSIDPVSSDNESPSKSTSANNQLVEHHLPLWIQEKDYSNLSPEEADKQLFADLATEDPELLERDFVKYLFIDEDGKAYVHMPTNYHETVVLSLISLIRETGTPDDPLFVEASGQMTLTNSTKKYPDVWIFGKERTKKRDKGRPGRVKTAGNINPHAIIEVSWSNKIGSELKKFALQLNRQNRERGIINAGYLLKFIPLTELPTEEDHPERPLIGVDVYRMEAPTDDSNVNTRPVIEFKWRQGDDLQGKEIKFTAEQLGRECDVCIPLEWVIDDLKQQMNVRFQSPPSEH